MPTNSTVASSSYPWAQTTKKCTRPRRSWASFLKEPKNRHYWGQRCLGTKTPNSRRIGRAPGLRAPVPSLWLWTLRALVMFHQNIRTRIWSRKWMSQTTMGTQTTQHQMRMGTTRYSKKPRLKNQKGNFRLTKTASILWSSIKLNLKQKCAIIGSCLASVNSRIIAHLRMVSTS